jgi:hypothetical protein
MQHNKEVMQLLGDLGTPSFVRMSQLNLTGFVNRMDGTRTASQVSNNNPQGSRLRGRPETRWWNCIKQILMDAILKPGKGGQKNRSDWERSIKEARGHNGLQYHLRRSRSDLK